MEAQEGCSSYISVDILSAIPDPGAMGGGNVVQSSGLSVERSLFRRDALLPESQMHRHQSNQNRIDFELVDLMARKMMDTTDI
ncbi:hypothetical protein MLD38_031630 [Melastoma candidum]|uniref:Uncharacterized protein n=1 Tax=Melastoma candidum TaxID=119954 RepID=A0ACB9MSA4_9MYRT|nr:hypothetical protein MLD38_031630 [Melastoma candidum]